MTTTKSDESLRIAILAETLTRGGAERQGYLLADELSQRGHDARVLSFWPQNTQNNGGSGRIGLSKEFPRTSVDHYLPRVFKVVALTYRTLRSTFWKKRTLRSNETSVKLGAAANSKAATKLSSRLLARLFLNRDTLHLSGHLANVLEFDLRAGVQTRLLIRYLQRQRCHIVISFLPAHNAIALFACQAVGIPVVVSERNDFLRRPVSDIDHWVRSNLYTHANLITANTEFAVEQIKCALPDNRVIWQPNKLRHSSTLPYPKEVAHHICVVSRLEPVKRIDTIIESLILLRAFGFFPKVSIFGEGSDESRLRSLVSELGVDDQVNFMGYVPSAKIYGSGLAYGLFLSNSKYEGSSNSLHEAVAAGLIPLVSDTITEIYDILRTDLTGTLVTNGSAKDIACKVQNIFRQSKIGQHLFAQVFKDFNTYWNRSEAALNESLEAFIELARNN